jgi:hypothetical protein
VGAGFEAVAAAFGDGDFTPSQAAWVALIAFVSNGVGTVVSALRRL